MRIRRIHPTSFVVAETDQRASELRSVAKLLGTYRAELTDQGFSATESFILVKDIVDKASWAEGHSFWSRHLDDLSDGFDEIWAEEEDDDEGDDEDD